MILLGGIRSNHPLSQRVNAENKQTKWSHTDTGPDRHLRQSSIQGHLIQVYSQTCTKPHHIDPLTPMSDQDIISPLITSIQYQTDKQWE